MTRGLPDDPRRRTLTQALAALALPSGPSRAATAPPRLLRVPFVAAETGFDPAQISDLYSAIVTAHIFEAPCTYDHLARPAKPKPLTAVALPQASADFKTWTVRLRPGIHFADDPAFKGKPRELTAHDYVYTLKRFYDPALKSPAYSLLHEDGIAGLQALRDKALASKRPFDYDTEIEGLRALDRYTVQYRLDEPRPRFLYSLCNSSNYGAVAREVVERYGDEIMGHPVGTGPYRLAEWRRSSRIVLRRNETFREMLYDAEPAADDAQGQAWLRRFKGRRLPLNDGIEISVLEEGQGRWLSFLNGEIDCVRVPPEYADLAVPGGKLAPNLVKRGVSLRRYVNPDVVMSWFNMEDPVVGGYAPEKVALRRAVELAYDIDREVRIVRRGQAVPAQAMMPPGTFGHDPRYRSENAAHDPARAKALLDTYGYLDRDGDGWREMPDGSPLVLQMATQSSQIERQMDELWQKSLAAVGVRIRFRTAQWPENLKAARAGKLQMWSLGNTASRPDAQEGLEYMYGPSIGEGNLARARLPGFDTIYRRMLLLPDGPERAALFIQASNIVTAYMPYRMQIHRVYSDLSQPWITGYRQPLFHEDSWHYVEVDTELRDRLTR